MGAEMKFKLVELYSRFSESIYEDCNLPIKATQIPLNVVEKIFNIDRDPYVVFLTPGLSLR